jgi:ankyrin repeat protein
MITANQMGEAAQEGDLAKLKDFLKDFPSLVNSHNDDGWTPLHLAAHYGHREVVELLLARGAQVNLKSENSMKNTAVRAAVAGNRTNVVDVSLARSASVNTRQHGGWTALHGAAQNGNREMVRILLDYGADPKLKNDHGQTAPDIALEAGHGSIADMLI